MPFPTTLLNDGNKIPQIAFGTGTALYRKEATQFVEQAIENGFSHIDTAAMYHNEEDVGTALQGKAFKREVLYITTKYGGSSNVREEFETSLKKLGLSYVDLYLIHSPRLLSSSLADTWIELEKIQADGLAKSIGVSNFTVQNLQELLKTAKVIPAVNQVRFHPYNYGENASLLEFSAKYGIITEAFSALTPITGRPGGAIDEPIQRAAERIGATPAQAIFSWVKSKGVVIVTTTRNKDRIQEYLSVADLPLLTAQEIADIDALGIKGNDNTETGGGAGAGSSLPATQILGLK